MSGAMELIPVHRSRDMGRWACITIGSIIAAVMIAVRLICLDIEKPPASCNV